MERKIYPYKTTVPVVQKLAKPDVATAIIVQRELGLSKAQAIGPVLDGSDDVATFNEVWGEIEAERLSLETVAPSEFATESQFRAALTSRSTYLSPEKWLAGIKTKLGISQWSDVKALKEF